MNTTASALARLARRIAGVVAECDYAQRRMLALRTMPDLYLPDRDKPPEDFAEFLYRTSGVLRQSRPRAAGRTAGLVR